MNSTQLFRNQWSLFVMGGVVLFLGCLLAPRAYWKIEPFYIPGLLIALSIVVALALKLPGVTIAPILFMGKLKAHAAEGFSPSDPTFWALLLVIIGICAQATTLSSARGDRTVWRLLRDNSLGLVAFALCAGIITISYFYTDAPIYGGDEARKFGLIGSLLFFAPLVIISDRKQFKAFVIACVAFSTLLIIKRATVLMSLAGNADATSIGAGELFGMTALLLVTFRLSSARFWRLAAFVMVAILSVATLASVSRGAVMCLFTGIVLSLLFGPNQTGLGSRKVTIVAFGAILATLVLAFSWVAMFAPQRFESKTAELSELGSSSGPEGTAGIRLRYWKETAAGFWEHPFFGGGIGSTSVYLTGMDQREYPHNLIVQIAFEQGIVGLGTYLFLLACAFRCARKAWVSTGGALACTTWVLLFHSTLSLTTGDLDDQRPLWTWCGIAFATWSWAKAQAPASRQLTEINLPEREGGRTSGTRLNFPVTL